MDPERGDRLLEGWRALEAARWDAARAAFEAALSAGESAGAAETPDASGGAGETADARDGLGQALWFLGGVVEAIAARERAFEEYLRDGRCDDAARVAVWVSHQHHISGRASAARGWLSRAERALEGAEPCAGHGWVAVERARHAESVEECVEHAQRAMAIARETGAADLEVLHAQPARACGCQRRAPAGGDAAARGGDGGRLGWARPQRPHAR